MYMHMYMLTYSTHLDTSICIMMFFSEVFMHSIQAHLSFVCSHLVAQVARGLES